MTNAELKMYEEFGCSPTLLGYEGNRRTVGLREKLDRTHRYYLRHEKTVKSVDEMIRAVRDEWTAGLGPIASWFMWQALSFLVKKAVIWLWNHYHSSEGIASREPTW